MNIKKITIALILGVATSLWGCERNPSKRLDNAFVNDLNAFLEREQIHYHCLVNHLEFSPVSTQTPTGYRCDPRPPVSEDEKSKDLKAAMQIRNNFIERAILIIDANYEEFVVALGEGRSRGNFIADIAELGTSAAIGVINNVSTLQVLGVSLTAFRGARSSFDLNFYEKQTTPILINTMDAGRNRVYQIILQKKNRGIEGTDGYSLTEAIKDVVAYYNAGTLIRAFTTLSRDAAIQAQISDDEVLRLQNIRISPVVRSDTDPGYQKAEQVTKILFSLRDDLKGNDQDKKNEATSKLQDIISAIEKDSDFETLNTGIGINSKEKDGKKLLRALQLLQSKAQNDLAKFGSIATKIENTILAIGGYKN